MKTLFLLNGEPFLPLEKSRDKCRDSLDEMMQKHFDTRAYLDDLEAIETDDGYYTEVRLLGRYHFTPADLYDGLSTTDKNMLDADESYAYMENNIDEWFKELEETGSLNFNDMPYMSGINPFMKESNVKYEIVILDDSVDEDQIKLAVELGVDLTELEKSIFDDEEEGE